jgi:hypothetical protein
MHVMTPLIEMAYIERKSFRSQTRCLCHSEMAANAVSQPARLKSAEHVGDHAPTYVFVNHFLILGDEIVMTDGRRRGLIYCIGCLEISRGMLHRILTRVQEPS